MPMTDLQHSEIKTGAHITYLNRAGEGKAEAIFFLHGSGPGATAWSNWQHAVPFFGERYDSLAPDFIGFGKSSHPEPSPQGVVKWMRIWVDQVLELLKQVTAGKVHLVGNSLGGAVALHLLAERPERFDKVVLMGSVGVPVKLPRELDIIWGFYDDPSPQRMAQIIGLFAFDEGFIGDRLEEIARMRYEAAMKDEVRRSYEVMFPAPRQRHLDDMVVADAILKRIKHPTLIVHGRDDPIVPINTSYHLLEHLGGKIQMHVYGQCSHWTQIEYRESFHRLLGDFFEGAL